MTISTQTNKSINQGNGATTIFDYNFLIPTADDAVVIYTDADGVETTLASTQYTITGINDPAGGTVTYPLSGSPIATGTKLTIMRVLDYTQQTSISNQGPFYPTAVEGALDYAVMLIQQLYELYGRGLYVAASDTAPGALPTALERANQLLGFDASGNPTVAQPSEALVSVPMQPVVAAASLAAARTLLGVDFAWAWGATSGGSANAQTVTADAYEIEDQRALAFVAGATNTGPTTLNVNAVGAKSVVKQQKGATVGLSGGEIVSGSIYFVVYNDALDQFYLVNPSDVPLVAYRGGLILSNNSGTPNTVVDVSAGEAADDTNIVILKAAAGSINFATTGANALDTGVRANNTTYYCYVIMKADGTTAFLASTSSSSPTLPSGYVYKRNLGTVRTDGSANIRTFVAQNSDFITSYRLGSRQIFTASGTWTRPTGCRAVFVQVLGPGGGGGGATGAATDASCGAGGGAGEYAEEFITFGLGATETVTVGTGGNGGAASGTATAGSNGSGASSFGSHLSAAAGQGGPVLTNGTSAVAVVGGDGGDGGTGGDRHSRGQQGGTGIRFSGTSCASGAGGNGPWGGGGAAKGNGANNGEAADANTGSGGSGATSNSTSQRAGGNGAAGIVIVWEYY